MGLVYKHPQRSNVIVNPESIVVKKLGQVQRLDYTVIKHICFDTDQLLREETKASK